MKIPQIILLSLMFFNLIIYATRYFVPKGKEVFWLVFLGDLIYISLLIWGGFFK